MTRIIRVTLFMGLFVLLGGSMVACGRTDREALETMLSGNYDTFINMPRSSLRDLVRDAARRSDGEPLFESIAPNYAFEGNHFYLEGEYRDPSGTLRTGYLDLVIEVEEGRLVVSVADHNLAGLESETERLGADLSAALDEMVVESADQEVIRYLWVRTKDNNQLLIGHTLKADVGQGVIPLDYP